MRVDMFVSLFFISLNIENVDHVRLSFYVFYDLHNLYVKSKLLGTKLKSCSNIGKDIR